MLDNLSLLFVSQPLINFRRTQFARGISRVYPRNFALDIAWRRELKLCITCAAVQVSRVENFRYFLRTAVCQKFASLSDAYRFHDVESKTRESTIRPAIRYETMKCRDEKPWDATSDKLPISIASILRFSRGFSRWQRVDNGKQSLIPLYNISRKRYKKKKKNGERSSKHLRYCRFFMRIFSEQSVHEF